MLVRFAVHPALLEIDRSETDRNPALISEHRRLCKLALKLGVLCIPSDAVGLARLTKAIKNMPTPLQACWLEAVHGRLENVPELNTLGAITPSNVRQMATACVDLICLPDDTVPGAADGNPRPLRPEICKLHEVDFTRVFQQAEVRASQPIMEGTTTEAVWSQRLSSLFRTSQVVTIVDRYLLRRLLDARQPNESGLDHLIRWVGRDAPGCHVTIFTALAPNKEKREPTPAECWAAVEGSWMRASMRGPASLSIHVIPSKLFGDRAHGRHIRFEECVVEVDVGLEVLENEKTRRMCAFSLKRLHRRSEHGKVLIELEDALRKAASMERTREWRRAAAGERAAG